MLSSLRQLPSFTCTIYQDMPQIAVFLWDSPGRECLCLQLLAGPLLDSAVTTHLRLQVPQRKETLLQVSQAPTLPIGDLKVFIVGLSRIPRWEVGWFRNLPWNFGHHGDFRLPPPQKKILSRIKHGRDGIRLSPYLSPCQLFHLFKAFSVNSSCAGINTWTFLSYLLLLQKPFWVWFASLFLLPSPLLPMKGTLGEATEPTVELPAFLFTLSETPQWTSLPFWFLLKCFKDKISHRMHSQHNNQINC